MSRKPIIVLIYHSHEPLDNILVIHVYILMRCFFSLIGGDSIKVDESLFQDLEELDLDAEGALDDDSS